MTVDVVGSVSAASSPQLDSQQRGSRDTHRGGLNLHRGGSFQLSAGDYASQAEAAARHPSAGDPSDLGGAVAETGRRPRPKMPA